MHQPSMSSEIPRRCVTMKTTSKGRQNTNWIKETNISMRIPSLYSHFYSYMCIAQTSDEIGYHKEHSYSYKVYLYKFQFSVSTPDSSQWWYRYWSFVSYNADIKILLILQQNYFFQTNESEIWVKVLRNANIYTLQMIKCVNEYHCK